MIAIERPYYAYLDGMRVITIIDPSSHDSDFFSLLYDEKETPLNIVDKIDCIEFVKYICHSAEELDIGRPYWIMDASQRKTDLQIGAVTRTPQFDYAFDYDGKLGVTYDQNETSFKLWAPTATNVKLKLISSDGTEPEMIDMIRGDRGVWSLTVHKDIEYYRYTYLVCVNLNWEEAVDPYAVSVTANGEEGVVVDLNKTKISKRLLPPLENAVDSIIYETHIRDFTIHPNSGVHHKGTYMGAAECNTKGKDGSPTCLSYIKYLGITHLELLPLHDFAGVNELGDKKEYNWGYNPLHFNVPDGSYSLAPQDPYKRIQELKNLIDTLHQNEIRVIMDVVYNHVYIREASSFEKIVPSYYFRYDEFGMPSNGTGVGNDIASERKMVRKFIIDSVLYWLEEYHVDGFRFDLMGILDIQTMKEIRNAIDQIDSTILIIGEGWDLNTPLASEKKANIHNQKELPGIGQFNDAFRDCIKGSTFNLYDKGFVLGNEHYYDMAVRVLAGSIGLENERGWLFEEPCQSVNYVESHDNHTLWDKLLVCLPDENEEIIRKFHRLATVMVILSQGIPFLHSGQEFFRTKNGDGNSYMSGNEINWLDWNQKIKYSSDVEYIKGLIEIRKAHQALRFPSPELIRKYMKFLPLKKPLIGWLLHEVGQFGPWNAILVIINPTKDEKVVLLPRGKWNVIANDTVCGLHIVHDCVEKELSLKEISSYVLISNDDIER
jgi:pullulanase